MVLDEELYSVSQGILNKFFGEATSKYEFSDSKDLDLLKQDLQLTFREYNNFSYEDLIKEIQEWYKKCETHLNNAHFKLCGFIVSSINELRYAGYHQNKASYFKNADAAQAKGELISALAHIKRAYYDCLDIEFLMACYNINNFVEEHSMVLTSSQVEVSAKEEIQILLGEASRFIESLDKDRIDGYFERTEYYNALAIKLPQIVDICKKIGGKNKMLLSIYKKEIEKTRKETKFNFFNIVCGIITIVSFAFAIYCWCKTE